MSVSRIRISLRNKTSERVLRSVHIPTVGWQIRFGYVTPADGEGGKGISYEWHVSNITLGVEKDPSLTCSRFVHLRSSLPLIVSDLWRMISKSITAIIKHIIPRQKKIHL